MPKIRRKNLLPQLLNHLLDRIKARQISPHQLGALADWLDTNLKSRTANGSNDFPQ